MTTAANGAARGPGVWNLDRMASRIKKIDSAVVSLYKGRCSTHYFGSAADPDVCRSQSARAWPWRCNEKSLCTLCYTAVDELCVNAEHEMLLLGKELQSSIFSSAGEAGARSRLFIYDSSSVATIDI